jgi:hypothetical protein
METLIIKNKNGEKLLSTHAYQILTNANQAHIIDPQLYA